MRKSVPAVLAGLMLSSPIFSAQEIFSPESFESLYADRRSLREGGLVTVLIIESSSATANNGTSVSHAIDIEADLRDSNNAETGGIRIGAEKSGEGTTQREGRLQARMTVPIQEVLPNGDLHVAGEQTIVVNGEEQVIRLSGIARREDILANNTVLSTRLGSARIEYTGEGLADESRRKGFFVWLLSKLRLI